MAQSAARSMGITARATFYILNLLHPGTVTSAVTHQPEQIQVVVEPIIITNQTYKDAEGKNGNKNPNPNCSLTYSIIYLVIYTFDISDLVSGPNTWRTPIGHTEGSGRQREGNGTQPNVTPITAGRQELDAYILEIRSAFNLIIRLADTALTTDTTGPNPEFSLAQAQEDPSRIPLVNKHSSPGIEFCITFYLVISIRSVIMQ